MQQYHHQYTSQCYFRWDHPREYGENDARAPYPASSPGSSPRIRGKCCRRCSQRTLRADHPREYGENAAQPPPGSGRGGSSPRIRGKSCSRWPGSCSAGIIPANTGKITRWITPSIQSWDHPREYGENPPRMTPMVTRPGSSPRIRGKLLNTLGYVLGGGIIPANTGKMFPCA